MEHYNYSLDYLEKDHRLDPLTNAAYKSHFKNVVASNIASIKLNTGILQGVEHDFKEELKSSIRIAEPRITVQAFTNLSEYYLLDGRADLAFVYNDSALDYLKRYKSPEMESRILEVRGRILLTQDEPFRSQVLFNEVKRINDSIQRTRDFNNYNEAAIEFDLNATQENLKQATLLLEQKDKINSYQRIILSIILLTSVLLAYQYLKIRRKNKAILGNEISLSKALKAKGIMLDEIHHRIKNNLQMVSGILEIKSSKLVDVPALEVMSDAQQYIQSMAYVHQHLYPENNETVLDMQHYFEELSSSLILNFPEKQVMATIETNGIALSTEEATPLGLITCELITNSMKHAFDKKGTIEIILEENSDGTTFIYTDNGKGFDLEKPSKPDQMGNNLINALAEELNANLKRKIDQGFYFKLEFKQAR